jgi:signal transduction histidine kinase
MEQAKQTTTEAQGQMQGEALKMMFTPSGIAGASLPEVAHEARNMVAALGLYCDLLDAPGVFAEPYQHYGSELKMVAAASRGLVDRLLTLSSAKHPDALPTRREVDHKENRLPSPQETQKTSKATRYWDELPPVPINNFAWELQTNRNLLAALAGPSIVLSIDAVGGALPVLLSGVDLTRILVNLVKNSVEAMEGSGGRIQLVLRESKEGPESETRLFLNVEDNGLGIAPHALDRVFESGYTTRSKAGAPGALPQAEHRGLGLAITRSVVEAAGGRVRAANRDPQGTCIQIELPVRPS